jgi:hypothetical protein
MYYVDVQNRQSVITIRKRRRGPLFCSVRTSTMKGRYLLLREETFPSSNGEGDTQEGDCIRKVG